MSDNTAPEPGATNNPRQAALGVTVASITTAYEKAEPRATPQQMESVLWLFRHAKNTGVRGNEGVGKLFTPHRDASAISKLFGGTYGASLVNICADIDKLREMVAQQAEVDGEPVIKLPWLTSEVHSFANLVHATRTIGLIFGPNQNGKTVAIDSHIATVGSLRRVIRVNMPAGAPKTKFLRNCLEAVGISPDKANGELEDYFAPYLNRHTELIIDEFHQCWVTGSLKAGVVEMVRRWRDERGCSLLLVTTSLDAFRDRKFAGVLSQIGNRGVLRLRVPDQPKRVDVDAICEAYRLRPALKGSEAEEIVDEICGASGLGKLCKYLQIARYLANAQKSVLSWEHFVTAHKTMQGWAGDDEKSGKGGN